MNEAKEQLRALGYCLLPTVLMDRDLHTIRELLDEIAAHELGAGTHWNTNGNQRIFALCNKHNLFLDLAAHPAALAMATHLLGPDRLLSSITANIALPGNRAQALHTDQQYVTPPWPWPATINILWLIDCFSEANGGTRVVPGTHLFGMPPFSPDIPTVAVEAPAGSLLCIDGRLWHAAGQNSTGAPRRAILSYYCLPFLRQQENIFRSLPHHLRRRLTPELRQLLGYDVWSGLGVVNGLPPAWMETGQRSGPTNADHIFDAP